MGKGTVGYVTLHAIQTLFLQKSVVKYLEFKVGHLAVFLRRWFTSSHAKACKAKDRFRAKFNNYKSAYRSIRKKRKVSQQRFHEHHGQYSHNRIDDWQFILIEQRKTHE